MASLRGTTRSASSFVKPSGFDSNSIKIFEYKAVDIMLIISLILSKYYGV
jgi:hypothetical protein